MTTTALNYSGPAIIDNKGFAKLIEEAKLERALFSLTAERALERTCDTLLNDAKLVLRSRRDEDVIAKWREIETVAADAKAPNTATHADAIKALEHCQNPDHAYGVCNH